MSEVLEIRGEETRIIQDLSVRASFVPDTINEEKRTVDLVFATENPVRKWTWENGYVYEILGFEEGEVNLSRFNNGANFIDNHQTRGSVIDIVVGVCERAWIEGKKGYVTVRFSKKESAEIIWQDIKDGILRNVSVGYTVQEYTVTKKEGDLDIYRATRWTAMEVSTTAVPADPDAQVRSNSKDARQEITIIHKNANMANDTEKPAVVETQERSVEKPAPVVTPPVDETKIRQEAMQAERMRVKDIQDATRKAGLDSEFAQKYIEDGSSVDAVRTAILDELESRQEQISSNNNDPKLTGKGEIEKRLKAVTSGLLLRSGQANILKLNDEERTTGRSYRGISLLDIAKECLVRAGEKIDGLLPMEIVGRAITSSSSDFPVILEGTIRRVLLANYSAIEDTWRSFCMVGSVSDFREHKRLRMGSLSRLDKVQENQEYKNKSIPDAEFEKIYAETYGNIINVSRKMIINDDLQAFTRLAQMLGRAASRSIEEDVYSLFALNSGNGPTMQDGDTLFHANHGNIGTGAAISVAALDADRVLMAKQKDPSGNDYIGLRPSVLLVPVELGGTARVINEAQYDPDTSGKLQRPNMVNGLFSNIVDTPRISGTARYLFADPMDEPVFEVAFLNGVETPFMEMQESFNVDGMTWKVRHDYGFGAIGWRGVVKNAGA